MTQENQSLPTLPSGEKSLVVSDTDFFLMTLVHLFNNAKLELGITLFSQGTIISGLLISESSYFEGVSNELKTTDLFSSEDSKKAIDSFLNSFQTNTISSANQEENKPIHKEFIHLKNVTIHSGNSLISFERVVYWRGRLSRIDGFFIGNSQNVL